MLTLDEIGIALEKGKQAQLIKLLSNRRRESQIEGYWLPNGAYVWRG